MNGLRARGSDTATTVAHNPLFFLPGVGADPNFWQAVGDRLPADWPKVYFGWPGLGHQPPHPAITSYDDLIRLVEDRFEDEPVDILAQSMGGAIAMALALKHPEKVRRLVLCTTSGGLDVSALGASDWRPAYRSEFPHVPDWVMAERPNIADRVSEITQPVLLIWGDNDPISPLSVGEHLLHHLPNARLHVVNGGEHDLVLTHADDISRLIQSHLTDPLGAG